MSEAGKYQRPSLHAYRLGQQPARGLGARRDALGRLAQDLNALIHNAADPFELAAHLEALGYNNKRTAEEFNLPTPFALARKLFHGTDRRPDLIRRNPTRRLQLGWQQALIGLTVMSTLLLMSTELAQVSFFALLSLWLITWSVTGTRMIYLAKQDLRLTKQRAVFTLLVLIGLAGIAASWIVLLQNAIILPIALLWWGVSGCLWLEHLRSQRRYWWGIVALNAVVLLVLLPMPGWLVSLVLLAISVIIFTGHLGATKRSTLEWFGQHLSIFLPYLAYGAGLGLILIKLFQGFVTNLWLAGGLLILVLFLTEWLTVAIRRSLAKTMWRTQSSEEFKDKSLSIESSLWQLIILFAVLSGFLVLQIVLPSTAALNTHFVLFGLATGLASILFSLNKVFLPAFLFLMAGLLSLTSIAFVWILVFLALALVFLLSDQLNHVEDYGFYIIG